MAAKKDTQKKGKTRRYMIGIDISVGEDVTIERVISVLLPSHDITRVVPKVDRKSIRGDRG